MEFKLQLHAGKIHDVSSSIANYAVITKVPRYDISEPIPGEKHHTAYVTLMHGEFLKGETPVLFRVCCVFRSFAA
jgi:hypothetical protein